MDDQVKHFSHEHPLTYKEEAPPKNEASGKPVSCSACGETVLGPNYACTQCSDEVVVLHKPCAQLGREIQHPMHEHPLTILTGEARIYIDSEYYCDICHETSYGKSYSCSKCRFDLDLKCAANLTNIVSIKHFSHRHLLRFIEKPSKGGSTVFCIGCLEPVLGPCYTCDMPLSYRPCSVFLHKSCAELPLEIQHPLHRQHLLTLNLNGKRECHCDSCDQDCSRRFNYSCFECGFNLDLKCTSVKGFKHFSHKHRLMFKKRGGNDDHQKKGYTLPLVVCECCKDPVLGPSYSCIHTYRRRKCRFNLHKSCAELPLEIQHPLHRHHPLFLLNTIQDIKVRCFCNACNQPCRYRYSCSTCDFNLHFKCATNWQNIIDNDSHQHQFILPRKAITEVQLNCDVCGEYWSAVIFYICTICQLLVHEECASFPSTTDIPEHQHRLKLTWFLEESYPKEQLCNICSKNIGKSPTVYYCQECCGYVAHTTCMAVEYFQKQEYQDRSLNIEVDDYESDDDDEIKHFSHKHPLVAKDYSVLEDRIVTCQGCIRPITQDFYSCTKQDEESCQFYLHKICARLPEKMLLPLLHQHQFTLLSRAPSVDGVFQCYMCGILHHGFVYTCDQCALPTGHENLFYLDLECSMYWETGELKHESHPHRLFLDMEYEDVCCKGCGSKIFFCFSCKRCNFHLCIACVRLPLTGRHRYDTHVLKLTYASRVEDEFLGYYCVICEGKRDPAHWFYWCEECKFDAHPHCIIGRYPRVKLGNTDKHDDHVQHQVTLVSKWKSSIRGDKRDNTLPCVKCSELCQGLVFECRECNINFHRDGSCGSTESAASSSRSPQIEEIS